MEKQNYSVATKPSRGNEILAGLGITAVLMVGGFIWLSVPAEAKDEYVPITPQAQVTFDTTLESLKSAEKAHKSSECSLVDAKLMDYANNYEQNPLSVEQVKELSAKRESCKKGF